MKKIWDGIGIFSITEQRLADQARQIRTNKKKIRRKLEQKNGKVEVEENDQEIIRHNENKQGESEEQGAQEILVEQGHENEQQQKTYHICSFPEDDEILVTKSEMENAMEGKRNC